MNQSNGSQTAMTRLWKRAFYDCETPLDRVLVATEILGFGIFVCAFIAGTLVNFTFPHQFTPNGCHFTDALIVYVACPQHWMLGRILSWSWLWTWGIYWLMGFLPYSLVLLIPESVVVWLAVRFVGKLARRNLD